MTRGALAAVLMLAPLQALAAITVDFEIVKINRASDGDCPAPCAVHVTSADTGATTDTATTREFHSLSYRWDYGDPSSGTWDESWQSGLSKNQDFGPVAGHVYESAGTYDITLYVENSSGDTGQLSQQVVVTDPGAHWSGARTVCASNTAVTAGADGCPLGATTRGSVTDFNSMIGDYNEDHYRVLLRCGDVFSAEGPGQLGDTWLAAPAKTEGSRVGTYGGDCADGNRARIDVDNNDADTSQGSFVMIETVGSGSDVGGGWSIVGFIEVVGDNADGGSDQPFFSIDNSPTNGTGLPQSERVFLYNLRVRDADTCINTHGNSGSRFIREFAVVDVECEGTGNGHTHYTNEQTAMWLGYHYDGTAGAATSGWRGQHARKWTLRHSKLDQESAPGNSNYIFQQRTCRFNSGTAGCNATSNRWVNIADNIFRAGDGGTVLRWCQDIQCSPVAASGTNWIDNHDLIFERNYVAFERALSTNQHMQVAGGDMTFRNNVFDLTGATGSDNRDIYTQQCFAENETVDCDEVHFLHNTIYAPESGYASIDFNAGAGTLIGSNGSSTDHRIEGNLVYAPSFTSGSVRWTVGTNVTAANNYRDVTTTGDGTGEYNPDGGAATGPFSTSLPAATLRDVADFELDSGTRVEAGSNDIVNAGTDYSAVTDRAVLLDGGRRCRPDSTSWDVGAHELSGGSPGTDCLAASGGGGSNNDGIILVRRWR